MRRGLGLVVGVVLLAGCSGGPTEPAADPGPSALPTAVPEELSPSEDSPVRDPRTVLALVPESATVLTVTDWDAVRARLGFNDLTSDDLMSDRSAFWDRAARDAVLLTEGLLSEDSSELMLDHGFTQDDVDWEARFTGPGGAGYVLAFRPGQDMAEVRRAVRARVGPLAGARVLADQHLLVSGVAEPGERVWAMDPLWPDLVDELGETTYLRHGCVPVHEALGPEASAEDQDGVVAELDPSYFRPLEGFAVSFGDRVATAWLGPDRIDLHDRANLAEIWPTTGSTGFADGYEGLPVADPATGRIGLQVENPHAAARLTLTGILPFGVCNEVEPIPEPTGL
jgi:hypothetical protein